MLKDFWQEKRHLIEMSGILAGVGALFLTIPMPENGKAATALLNIQLIWLIIISFTTFTILLQLLILTNSLESEMRKKDVDLDGGLAVLMVIIIGYFNFYLWRYIFILYKDSIFEVLEFAMYPMGTILGGGAFYIWRFIMKKSENLKKWQRNILSLLTILILTGLAVAIIFFASSKGNLNIEKWLILTCTIFFVLVVLSVYVDYRKRKAIKK